MNNKHDQALAAHVHDQRLVVEHQRVRFPPPVTQRLLRRKAGLEPRRAVDFAGDQHAAAEQEARLAVLDDREARALERGAAGRRQLDRVTAGNHEPATAPELRMDHDRQAGPADRADEAVQAGGVVGVAVAEHDGLNAAQVDAEGAHVRDEPVRAQPGVEQQPVPAPASGDRDQGGEAGRSWRSGPRGSSRPRTQPMDGAARRR